jgi:hypothetical protein
MHPVLFIGDIYTAKCHCQGCGTETHREFKRDTSLDDTRLSV